MAAVTVVVLEAELAVVAVPVAEEVTAVAIGLVVVVDA